MLVLGDQQEASIGRQRCVNGRGQFGQQVLFAAVEQRMGGVQPQAVEMVLVRPVAGVGDEEGSHRRTARPVQVQRVAPRRRVAIGKIRLAELAQVVAIRPKVIVDHVQQHGQAARVGRVHQAAQRLRAAVGARGREQAHAIVAPVALARKVGHRHQLDRRHAQVVQVVQPLDQRVERARVGRRPDMQLVDQRVFERDAAPIAIRPGERRRIDHLRGAVDAGGLKARGWVGAWIARVEPVEIARAWPNSADMAGEVAAGLRRQREHAGLALAIVQHHFDLAGVGGPDAKAHAARLGLRADRERPCLSCISVFRCTPRYSTEHWDLRGHVERSESSPHVSSVARRDAFTEHARERSRRVQHDTGDFS